MIVRMKIIILDDISHDSIHGNGNYSSTDSGSGYHCAGRLELFLADHTVLRRRRTYIMHEYEDD